MPLDAFHTDQPGLLGCLQQLMLLPALDLRSALTRVADLLVTELQADKADAFLYHDATNTLDAYGISDTPLGRRQATLGMDRVPLAEGGRTVEVFQTGQPYLTGRAELDPGVLRAVWEVLGVRSLMIVPLAIDGKPCGVLQVASMQPDYFSPEMLVFFEAIAQWVGLVTQRAELIEQLRDATLREARRVAAEELLTIVAHDLKNYLFPLQARLGLLQRRAEAENHTRNLHDLSAAQQAFGFLATLTDSLLDVARLDQGAFHLERQPVDLVALTCDVAEVLQADAVEIQVAAPAELEVEGDGERIQQVLANLMVNALKHSSPGVPIQVRVGQVSRAARDWAIVRVRNQGAAIDPTILPHLFERFVAGSGSPGLGVGLYIAYQIAEAHGGTLEVESLPGEGTSFRLALPLGQAEQGAWAR